MKIRTKIQWYSSLFLTIMFLVLSILVALSFFWLSLQREKEILEEQAQLIENHIGIANVTANQLETLVPDEGMIRIYNADQQIISGFADEEDLLALATSEVSEDVFSWNKVDGEYVLTFRLSVPDDGPLQGVIEVTQNMESIIDNLTTLLIVLSFTSLIVVIVSIFAGKRLAALILKPVSIMSKTMIDIEKSGEFQQIPLINETKDELEQMGATFNRMMERLEKNHNQQQKFLSDASHELKTPITIIESYASLLKRWGMKDAAIQEEAVEAIHHEALRMKELTGNLLQIASQSNLSIEQVEVVSLCEQVAKKLQQTSSRRVTVNAEPEVIEYDTDQSRLEQVLVILIDNALKYSEQDVSLSVRFSNGVLTIFVQDHGKGIPEQDLPHVFERFYRVDPSRTRSTGGNGLGLSIAQSIVTSLGGHIEMESEVGKGTTVKMTFLSKY